MKINVNFKYNLKIIIKFKNYKIKIIIKSKF